MFQKKNIPNLITCMRIIGSAALLFVPLYGPLFFVLYLVCGVSDVLDGFLARKWQVQSPFGSRLDSVADLLFYGVLLIRILPLLIIVIPAYVWWTLLAAMVLRAFVYLFSWIWFHTFASNHTLFNKATGFLAFLTPLACYFGYGSALMLTACIMGIIAALYELYYLASRHLRASTARRAGI